MLHTDLDNVIDVVRAIASWPATGAYVLGLVGLVAAYVLDFVGRPRLSSPRLARLYTRTVSTSLVVLAPALLIMLMFVMFIHGFGT